MTPTQEQIEALVKRLRAVEWDEEYNWIRCEDAADAIEALSHAPTYAQGYADALEAAAREARDMADANGPNGTEAAIRALPLKEKPDE